jgi:hypothetical protein
MSNGVGIVVVACVCVCDGGGEAGVCLAFLSLKDVVIVSGI